MEIQKKDADQNSDAETETHRLCGLPEFSPLATVAGLDRISNKVL